jgi:flagellin-like hook-associated protein FlgL
VTASNIQNSLIDMRTVAMSESDLLQNTYWGDKGKICDYFQQVEEGIIDMVNGHSWNGQNFMTGGGENNHTTTTLNFSFNAGGSDTSDNIQIELKSFHPHSAIDRDGQFHGNPAAPNLPDLNKTAGTDTHVYGDAALYHGHPLTGAPYKEGHLHGDNRDAIDHTIIQLDRAISGLTAERARLGGFLSRLSHMADNVTNEILNSRVRKSQIEDTDVASQVAEFSKREILKQTSIAMLTQINRKGSELLELLN